MMNSKLYQFTIFLKILCLRSAFNASKKISLDSLPNLSYMSLLTGDTYDLKKVARMDSNTIGKRSLDLSCIYHDLHCIPEDDNVIDVFFGVRTAEECQLTCEFHSDNCVMFTWFDQLEEIFPSSCFLYSRQAVLQKRIY